MKPFFGVFHATKPTQATMARIRATQADLDVTYAHVGSTLETLPTGYHHLRAERVVGASSDVSQDDLFAYGSRAISSWAAQAALHLTLEPAVPRFVEGEVLVFALPMKPSPVWATGACRIIRIVDEPDRFGFVYGTLPHHPESGEEAFLVHRDASGGIRFSITAFSRGSALPMRLSGPIGRVIQRRAAEIYLDGYERFARAGRSASL
jgi:uncharacterized protein (UPF0548 family)